MMPKPISSHKRFKKHSVPRIEIHNISGVHNETKEVSSNLLSPNFVINAPCRKSTGPALLSNHHGSDQVSITSNVSSNASAYSRKSKSASVAGIEQMDRLRRIAKLDRCLTLEEKLVNLQLNRAKLKAASRVSSVLAGFAMVAMVEAQITNDPDPKKKLPEILLILFTLCSTILVSMHVLSLMIATCLLPFIEAITNSYEWLNELHMQLLHSDHEDGSVYNFATNSPFDRKDDTCAHVTMPSHVVVQSAAHLPNSKDNGVCDEEEILAKGNELCMQKHKNIDRFISISWTMSNIFGVALFLVEVIILCWVKFWEFGPEYHWLDKRIAIVATVVMSLFLCMFLFFISYFYNNYVLANYFDNFTLIRKITHKGTGYRKCPRTSNGSFHFPKFQ